MFFQQLFAKKSLATLLAEAEGENRLRRVLGPVGLTSLGIGAIIGAGIFVMTGRVAAIDAGPAIVVSYVVAGVGARRARRPERCVFAAPAGPPQRRQALHAGYGSTYRAHDARRMGGHGGGPGAAVH